MRPQFLASIVFLAAMLAFGAISMSGDPPQAGREDRVDEVEPSLAPSGEVMDILEIRRQHGSVISGTLLEGTGSSDAMFRKQLQTIAEEADTKAPALPLTPSFAATPGYSPGRIPLPSSPEQQMMNTLWQSCSLLHQRAIQLDQQRDHDRAEQLYRAASQVRKLATRLQAEQAASPE